MYSLLTQFLTYLGTHLSHHLRVNFAYGLVIYNTNQFIFFIVQIYNSQNIVSKYISNSVYKYVHDY